MVDLSDETCVDPLPTVPLTWRDEQMVRSWGGMTAKVIAAADVRRSFWDRLSDDDKTMLTRELGDLLWAT